MKFLTDSQAPRSFSELLRKIGWDVETVYEHDIDKEKDDARLVAWARTFGMVFLCYDELRGEQGVKVNREIRERGGKVIVLKGGPEQPVERALGRLLFHHPDWYPFLEKKDGRVQISDLKQKCKMLDRRKMKGQVRAIATPAFEPYLDKREAGRAKRLTRRRRRRVSKEQSHMLLPGGAA